mgnify:CR=1 FL=1
MGGTSIISCCCIFCIDKLDDQNSLSARLDKSPLASLAVGELFRGTLGAITQKTAVQYRSGYKHFVLGIRQSRSC